MSQRTRLVVWTVVLSLTALASWALWVWMLWLGHGENWFERWWPLVMALPFTVAAIMLCRWLTSRS